MTHFGHFLKVSSKSTRNFLSYPDLSDPYPDHHQNLITFFLTHFGHFLKVSSKSARNFLSYVADRQTNPGENIYLLVGGKQAVYYYHFSVLIQESTNVHNHSYTEQVYTQSVKRSFKTCVSFRRQLWNCQKQSVQTYWPLRSWPRSCVHRCGGRRLLRAILNPWPPSCAYKIKRTDSFSACALLL